MHVHDIPHMRKKEAKKQVVEPYIGLGAVLKSMNREDHKSNMQNISV